MKNIRDQIQFISIAEKPSYKTFHIPQMIRTMDPKDYDYVKIEQKWQERWLEEKIYESKKEKQNKFFIHFAYPGVSGYLHVGHMRGFTYCDIIARYKRMTGFVCPIIF